MYPIETIKSNLTTIDRQLLYMLYEQQRETNRLLNVIIENNGKNIADEHTDSTTKTRAKNQRGNN